MKLLLLFAFVLISLNSLFQNFKEDKRPDSLKEDFMDNYQAGQISKVDLLSALDNLGVRIFNCQLFPRFTKTYKLIVNLEEFVNGKIISKKDISPDENNLYFFYDHDKQYADYISKIKIITRDADSVDMVTVNIMGNTGEFRLKKHFERKHQYYLWRRFSVTDWQLNTKVPMLIYSSSWYDKRFEIERFCGAVDLSNDKVATKELIDHSPHYFLISYEIRE